MEAIKNAASSLLGYGTTQEEQSGAEPVSGQTGEGTAVEPYDAGNKVDDKAIGGSAPQDIGSSTTSTSTTTHGADTGVSGHGTGLGGRSAREVADFATSDPAGEKQST